MEIHLRQLLTEAYVPHVQIMFVVGVVENSARPFEPAGSLVPFGGLSCSDHVLTFLQREKRIEILLSLSVIFWHIVGK